ncbi:uncharacterized protein LOC126323929 [Schistocerca gregaria]|uniref:uncharacterized protein LOC126323929 n=1 Tax=Schistocerca gregaria TaxID=7010 RepID=UPI00211DB401|nr:uncharacterized protein LOC126323929 [Schistocerca gregaria]
MSSNAVTIDVDPLVKPVPETLKKKLIYQRRASYQKPLSKTNDKEKQKFIFKRAEAYVKEYRRRRQELSYARKNALKKGEFFIEPEAKVAFVIRIRGILNVPPKPRKALQLLRLRRINSGVFVRLNKATLRMLQIVEPYITWGYPSLKCIRELVYKRGHASINHQRIPITNNEMIEQHLGQHDIICIEDLVYQLYTCGPHFREVTRFLWPFSLRPPRGGFLRKLRHYTDGGDSGNREGAINRLVRAMV